MRSGDGRAVGCDELIAWSRERMAGFKVPRYVEFLDELPLNATGKVMKDASGLALSGRTARK